MWRKTLLSIIFALLSVSLFVFGVMAQGADDSETPAVTVLPTVAAASVVQTVPVTLTLTIPGPTGPITVEVPVFLSLDIRIGISPNMTPTLAITPSVVTGVGGAGDDETGATVTATVESLVEAEADEPTATPTAAALAATTVPEKVEAEPTAIPLPTATPTPTTTPLPVAISPACADPRAVITAPGVGEAVSGTAQILGTASHENFLYYKVEYAQGENVNPDATFSYLADSRVQVTGGLLATFDSTSFINGVYTLKLTVVDASGNFPPPCTVSVIIEN